MTDQDRWLTLQSIREHEGFNAKPTADTGGTRVIGFGHNIDLNPLTKHQGDLLLEDDFSAIEAELPRQWPTFLLCDGPRQRCVSEMAYQLGVGGLMTFVNMLHAIAVKPTGSNPAAAAEVLNSGLARQTPSRAQDYAALLKED